MGLSGAGTVLDDGGKCALLIEGRLEVVMTFERLGLEDKGGWNWKLLMVCLSGVGMGSGSWEGEDAER